MFVHGSVKPFIIKFFNYVSYARFYELGLTRDSRVIHGLTAVSVLSTSNLGLNLLDRIELELRHATESHGGLLPIQQLVAILCISIVFVSGGTHFRVFTVNP